MDVPFALTAIFVGVAVLFGLFLLFVRGTNIERNGLVGGLTVLSAAIAAFLLYRVQVGGAPTGGWTFFGIGVVSLLGFAAGRIADYFLGPKEHSKDSREATLGADLSD